MTWLAVVCIWIIFVAIVTPIITRGIRGADGCTRCGTPRYEYDTYCMVVKGREVKHVNRDGEEW